MPHTGMDEQEIFENLLIENKLKIFSLKEISPDTLKEVSDKFAVENEDNVDLLGTMLECPYHYRLNAASLGCLRFF